MATPRLLVLMGSGETAPTMMKPHRALFDRLAPDPVPAVIVDTPYGFQENADEISSRAVEYFADSVGRPVDVASLRRTDDGDAAGRERALAQVAAARWVFAGPGSPTYTLRQWRGTEMPSLLDDKLRHGGCVVFASAAALTLGRYSVPVYEIYKSGDDPEWADGLDLTAAVLDPDVAVIPHYDNAEGGHHDTRFCYLGERRLRILETQLPESGWVLGVDEHTGVVVDIDAGTATVIGNGTVTVRRQGRSTVLSTGTTVTVDELRELGRGKSDPDGSAPFAVPSPRGADGRDAAAASPGGAGERDAASGAGQLPPGSAPGESAATTGGATPRDATPLHAAIRRLEGEFDVAVAASDVDAAVAAALELDDTVQAWANDTTQSDAGARARAALRRMIVRLGELARVGAKDPREVVGPMVEALLAERAAARAGKRWSDADRVRDALTGAGVEVRDTPAGTEWGLTAAR
jgi:cyanophycinase-like exopeptidase